MQDVATAQCSGEMGHRIRAEHQRNPRGACRRCQHPVWFSLRLEVTEVRIRQPTNHPHKNAPHLGDVRAVWSHWPMFGLPCHSNGN